MPEDGMNPNNLAPEEAWDAAEQEIDLWQEEKHRPQEF